MINFDNNNFERSTSGELFSSDEALANDKLDRWNQTFLIAEELGNTQVSPPKAGEPGHLNYVPSDTGVDEVFIKAVRAADSYHALLTAMSQYSDLSPNHQRLILRRLMEISIQSGVTGVDASGGVIQTSSEALLQQVQNEPNKEQRLLYLAALLDGGFIAANAPAVYAELEKLIGEDGKNIAALHIFLNEYQLWGKVNLRAFDQQWVEQMESGVNAQDQALIDELQRIDSITSQPEVGWGPTRRQLKERIESITNTNITDPYFAIRIGTQMDLHDDWLSIIQPLMETYGVSEDFIRAFLRIGDSSAPYLGDTLMEQYQHQVIRDYDSQRFLPQLQQISDAYHKRYTIIRLKEFINELIATDGLNENNIQQRVTQLAIGYKQISQQLMGLGLSRGRANTLFYDLFKDSRFDISDVQALVNCYVLSHTGYRQQLQSQGLSEGEAIRTLRAIAVVLWNNQVDMPEAQERIANRDLSHLNLSGLNLDEVDLRGLILSGANLSGTSLRSANLTGAQIIDADVADADLLHANLTDAQLDGTNLKSAARIYGVFYEGLILHRYHSQRQSL